jgi:ABC-type antimicrobial peptide transport system permease subunit
MLQNGARSPARANVYWIYDGTEDLGSRTQLALFVRPRPGAADLGGRLRRLAQAIGPPVVIDRIRTGEDFVADSVVVPRRRMQLLGLLGAVGLLLTVIGVFSVTAYTVARRTREIGIRIALGARARNVVRAFVGDACWPVAIGLLAGLGTAYLASRAIVSLLYATAPHDPVSYALAALALAVTAIAAAWLPARRAARIDPVAALRGD